MLNSELPESLTNVKEATDQIITAFEGKLNKSLTQLKNYLFTEFILKAKKKKNINRINFNVNNKINKNINQNFNFSQNNFRGDFFNKEDGNLNYINNHIINPEQIALSQNPFVSSSKKAFEKILFQSSLPLDYINININSENNLFTQQIISKKANENFNFLKHSQQQHSNSNFNFQNTNNNNDNNLNNSHLNKIPINFTNNYNNDNNNTTTNKNNFDTNIENTENSSFKINNIPNTNLNLNTQNDLKQPNTKINLNLNKQKKLIPNLNFLYEETGEAHFSTEELGKNDFHKLAKFFYNKRKDPISGVSRYLTQSEFQSTIRPPSYFDHFSLIKSMDLNPTKINELLQENSFNYISDLGALAQILDSFSETDKYAKDFYNMEDTQHRFLMEHMAFCNALAITSYHYMAPGKSLEFKKLEGKNFFSFKEFKKIKDADKLCLEKLMFGKDTKVADAVCSLGMFRSYFKPYLKFVEEVLNKEKKNKNFNTNGSNRNVNNVQANNNNNNNNYKVNNLNGNNFKENEKEKMRKRLIETFDLSKAAKAKNINKRINYYYDANDNKNKKKNNFWMNYNNSNNKNSDSDFNHNYKNKENSDSEEDENTNRFYHEKEEKEDKPNEPICYRKAFKEKIEDFEIKLLEYYDFEELQDYDLNQEFYASE